LYKRFNEGWSLAREAYLKTGEEFVMTALPPGEYEVRKMDVQTKNASKSQTFTLKEVKDSDGVRYSAMSLSFKVMRGNTKSMPITAQEF
jgi:poly-beta-hydroxyalkanoate depolymerase